MAEKAGKAAPAMAIAGVLVAAPQAHAAVKIPAKATTVVEQIHTEALITRGQPADRTYTVRPGDTLSSIAQRFYGNAADWPSIYHVNESVVQDPNEIYVGQVLKIPYDPPAGAASTPAASYTPRHAKATVLTSSAIPSGTLGCAGLETLWEDAGGAPSAAFMAAEIAMAESGGQQYAVGYDSNGTEDLGYWQINTVNGALATTSAIGNARSAVNISHDGTDWYPWTTYQTGAYEGRC